MRKVLKISAQGYRFVAPVADSAAGTTFGLCVPMSYRALSRSQLLRQLATKQFHVNRMIIYDQTGAEYVLTLNSDVQPHSG